MVDELQEELISDFEFLEDWPQKYEFLIDLGKSLEAMPIELKSDDSKIKGCQSNVWLHAALKDGKMALLADSDSSIVKGLIATLLRIYDGRSPHEILTIEPYFIEKIGMKAHLSPNRSNGLASMVKKIKSYALVFDSRNE